MTKTILKKKECKKAKWFSEEDLQIVEERSEVKGKGESGRYTQLNVEFQRLARRDKKAFLNEKCKEVEESNIIGEARYLFKKIRETKGEFHTRMGTIRTEKARP